MAARRFRTRPVEIEAFKYERDTFWDLHKWSECNMRLAVTNSGATETAQVYDKLHTTWINVSPGQWIIRGAKGEYYPCDDETFHWKYEEVRPKIKEWKTSTGPGD